MKESVARLLDYVIIKIEQVPISKSLPQFDRIFTYLRILTDQPRIT